MLLLKAINSNWDILLTSVPMLFSLEILFFSTFFRVKLLFFSVHLIFFRVHLLF